MAITYEDTKEKIQPGKFLLFDKSYLKVPPGVYIIHAMADTDVWEIQNTETLMTYFVTTHDIRECADEYQSYVDSIYQYSKAKFAGNWYSAQQRCRKYDCTCGSKIIQ